MINVSKKTTIGELMELINSGQNVRITGFGAFHHKHLGERAGLNPRTREPMTVPASRSLRFSVSPIFRERLNK